MDKTLTLIIHNLNKSKGQYISFGLIICLTAFIMNIALVLALQTSSAYDGRFEELDTADVNFMIPRFSDNDEVIKDIYKIDGVSFIEKHNGVLVTATVREFAGSDFDMNTVFYNIDEKRTLNRLDISENDVFGTNAVFIPEYIKELGGFFKGGNITYCIDGTDYTYEVGGIVSEMQYGNYGTGLIGGYLKNDAYEKFENLHGNALITEYSLKITDNDDFSQIKKAITEVLGSKGITVLNINDRAAGKQVRTMVCTLLIVIFLALAAIILAVSIFLSNFRIRSTIEDELSQMGVLKAVGYTGNMLIISVVAPYAVIGISFTVLGALLSYAVLPFVAKILAIQSGFSYTPVFDAAAFFAVIIALTSAILLFSYISARKIRVLEPINAIRGITGKINAGQNILLSAVSFGIMVLLSFAGTLLYNVIVKPDNFMNTLSEESPSVIFTAENEKLSELKEILKSDGRVRLVLEYASVSVSYENGSLTAFVCEDFKKAENNICYEGRSPVENDEAAVGDALADDYPIGSKIELTVSGKSSFYVVTGYVQSVNNAGLVCQLTGGGYEKIGEKPFSVNVYLNDENAEEFIGEYEKNYGMLITSSVNYEKLSESGRRMYAGIVSAVTVVLFLISVLVMLLVMYVIINSMICRRRQEYGIYKAIGYTGRQLTVKTALGFVPVVAFAAFLSAALGMWYIPVINNTVFGLIGAVKNHFEVSLLMLAAFAAAFTAAAFGISVLLAAPIKKITVYSLLKD